MGRGRWAGFLAVVLASAGAPLVADAQPATTLAAPTARLGELRVRVDPGVGEQDAAIRKLLTAFSFVRVAEPADYLVTTDPDLPLDLTLIDLRVPPIIVQMEAADLLVPGRDPTRFPIGNLTDPATPDRLAAVLTAAARLRALLDRSFGSMQGVEACALIEEDQTDESPKPATCIPMDQLGTNKIALYDWVKAIRVRNSSTGDRYVALAGADTTLKAGGFGIDGEPRVRKLAPGGTADFNPQLAAYLYPHNPRVFILVSGRPFPVEELDQPAPLDPDKECARRSDTACRAPGGGIALNDDTAVRSIQLYLEPEPAPAMGNGSDVTARMAVWMAQFYSVLPYSLAEIAADSRLPEDDANKQFLAHRTAQERNHRCGAALIGPNLILTAAHCVAKGQYASDAGLMKMMKERRVRLGSRRIGAGGSTYAIAGVAVHPGYDPNRQNDDLALLLIQPDRGSTGALPPPIAVADKPLPGGVKALAFGWGLTGAVAPNGNIMLTSDWRIQSNAEVLQYGAMTSVSLAECRKKLAGLVAPGMVCMYGDTALRGGQSADGVFTCRGDSGGPLVRNVGGRDVLVGVVSWSKGCGFKDYPSVFTDAGSYTGWIAAARAALKPGLVIRPADPARPQARASRN